MADTPPDPDGASEAPDPASPVLTFRAQAVDQAREFVRSVFAYPIRWEARTDAEPGGFVFGMRAFTAGPVSFGLLDFGSETEMYAGDLGVSYHLTLPTDGVMDIEYGGRREQVSTGSGRGLPVGPTGSTYAHFAPGSSIMGLAFDRHAVERELEAELERSVQTLRFRSSYEFQRGGGRTLAALAGILAAEAADPSGLLQRPPVADRLGRAMLTVMLHTTDHQYSEALAAPPPSAGPRSLRRAVEAMQADPAHPFTGAELARVAGVSLRSLQEAFRQQHHTSPMAYLRTLRLDGAHQDLLAADPADTTVTDVAARWGFTHASRFATYYRQRYGSSPSETLRSAGGGVFTA